MQKSNEEVRSKKGVLEIFTLGSFSVKVGNRLISEDRSKKMWKLFKYLITQKNVVSHPEAILETLWPDQRVKNPQNTLKNHIYRLRNILEQESGDILDGDDYFLARGGSYVFNWNSNYWLDAEEFENLSQEGKNIFPEDPVQAREKYRAALALYQGDYLSELPYEDWLLPVRKFYRDLYHKTILELGIVLKEEKDFAGVEELLEEVLQYEVFEEDLHALFIEALIEQKKNARAKAHYDYVMNLFLQELGVRPGPELSSIFANIEKKIFPVEDLGIIQESLGIRKEAEGSYYCDPDFFQRLCRLEERRVKRSRETIFLISLSLVQGDGLTPEKPTLEAGAELLRSILRKTLRRGDVFCRWSDAQFLVLLLGIGEENVSTIVERIEDRFFAESTFGDLFLQATHRLLS